VKNRICGVHRIDVTHAIARLIAQRESIGSGKRIEQLDIKFVSAGSPRVEHIPILGIAARASCALTHTFPQAYSVSPSTPESPVILRDSTAFLRRPRRSQD
jgi:hypothetical protein